MADKLAVRRYWRRGVTGVTVGSVVTAAFLALAGVVGWYAKFSHDRDDAREEFHNTLVDKAEKKCDTDVLAKKIQPGTLLFQSAKERCITEAAKTLPPKAEKVALPYKLYLIAGLLMLGGALFGARMVHKGAAYIQLARRKGYTSRQLAIADIPDTTNTDAILKRQGVVIKNGVSAIAEINLTKGAGVVAQPGSLAAMDSDIGMQMRMIDTPKSAAGLFGRLASGEGLSMVHYRNEGTGTAQLVLSPEDSRGVLAMPLQGNEAFYCKRGAFFAAVGEVTVGFERIKNMSLTKFTGMFGLQRISATGDAPSIALLATKGLVQDKVLGEGATIRIPAKTLVAAAGNVTIGLWEQPTGMGRLFSGNGAFLTTVTGPGRVWYEVPLATSSTKEGGTISRLIDRVLPG